MFITGSRGPVVELLYLMVYTLAVLGAALPVVFRKAGGRRTVALGHFLQALAACAFTASLQVFLDAVGAVDSLPGPWRTVVQVVFNDLLLAALTWLGLSWWRLARAYRVEKQVKKKRDRLLLAMLTGVVVINLVAQPLALDLRRLAFVRLAQYALALLLLALLFIFGEGILRVTRALKKDSKNKETAMILGLPLLLLSTGAAFALPTPWSSFLPPVVLLALFALALGILTLQISAARNPNTARQRLFDEASLTPREREIALLLAQGRSYKDVSGALFLSLSTVQTHVTRIYGKLKVSSKTELSRLLSGDKT